MMSDPDSSSEQSVLAASLKSFSEVFRWVLKNILLWLLEKEQKEICDVDNVTELTDEDEGYNSLTSRTAMEKQGIAPSVLSKHGRKRARTREEDLKIVEEDSKEVLVEKFLLLRDAYDDLRDDTTRLEFEIETLKDEQEEKEEEMKLQRIELLHMTEKFKVLENERNGDRQIIENQQKIINECLSTTVVAEEVIET